MGQTTNFNSNNTENGWIYNYFGEKISKIEKDMVELMNTVEQAYSDMKISLNEYNTLTSAINSKCSTEVFNTHAKNNTYHVTSLEKAVWNAKLNPNEIDSIVFNVDPDNGTPYEMNIIMKGNGRKTYIIPVYWNSKDE